MPGYGRDDCDPLSGRGVEQPVTWRDRRELPGGAAPIRLRFLLRRSALYAFNAGPELAPDPAPVRSLAIDFEGEAPARGATLRGGARVAADPERGSTVALLESAGATVDLADTAHLGTDFTLALRARTSLRRVVRLFSSYRGVGNPATGELVFDGNPASGVLRLIATGQGVQSRPRYFADGLWHHFAATYRAGHVELYLDGRPVGAGEILPGSAHLYYDGSIIQLFREPGARSAVGIHLATDLRVGEDQGGRFITYQDAEHDTPAEQLIGAVDDLLVAWRAYTPDEVANVAKGRASR